MKKKLAVFSFLGIVSVFGVVLAALANKDRVNFIINANVEYSLTIDGDTNVLVNSTESSALQTLKTQRGGNVQFTHLGVSYDEGEGKYSLAPGGYLFNMSPINGIFNVRTFTVDSAMSVFYGWSFEEMNNHYEFDGSDVSFEDERPSHIIFSNHTENTLYFSGFQYQYDCQEREAPSDAHVENVIQDFDGDTSSNCILFETGTSLASINFDDIYVSFIADGDYHGRTSLGSSDFSNVSIEYTDDNSIEAIQEGRNDARLSFVYNEHQLSTVLSLVGYTSFVKTYQNYASFYPYALPVKESDDIPEGLKLQLRYRYEFYDSKSAVIPSASMNGYNNYDMTQAMVKEADEHPFKQWGEHLMTVTFEETDYFVTYVVYDEENYNIEYLGFSREDSDRLSQVTKGTSADDYLNSIGIVTVNARLYIGDPIEVNLTKSNFDVSGVNFDAVGQYLITIHYLNYEQQLYISVVGGDMGEPLATYTSNEGVPFMGANVTQIDLYEDDIFVADYGMGNFQGTYEEKEGYLVLDSAQVGLIKVNINKTTETGGTFSAYDYSTYVVSESLMADLSVLSAPAGFNFPFVIYTNGEYSIDVGSGMIYRGKCTKTDNKVYFDMMGRSLVGTIDGTNMSVALVTE